MKKRDRALLIRILASLVLSILLEILVRADVIHGWIAGACYLVPYLMVGYDVLLAAVRGIAHGQLFDEHFLMGLATIGAFALQDFREAVAVMLFYQVGELFQSIALGKARKNIATLMDIRPDAANLITGETTTVVDPSTVAIGSLILIRPGEKVPLDGVILEGSSAIDASMLTGESRPVMAGPGDSVLSGTINVQGTLTVKTLKSFGESTAAKVIDLVENASSRKAKSEAFITKFARIYTPVVVASALLVAVVPPLVRMLALSLPADWTTWITRALTFLVISCPCAVVVSVPLAFFGGIGGASRDGILVKGANYLETLADVTTAVFDKTGTLTEGTFVPVAIHPSAVSEEELLSIASLSETHSLHPIALSLRQALVARSLAPLSPSRLTHDENVSGEGVIATIDGHEVACGSQKLLSSRGIACEVPPELGTVVFVSRDEEYLGSIVIADRVKETASEALALLKDEGIKRTVMLTGDREEVAQDVARRLGFTEHHASLLPADKVTQVERLVNEKKGKVAFIGDGINDAPVIARADVGIAMGALGSDAAIEAADVVLMDDDPRKVALAVRIARRTLWIVRSNVIFALVVKFSFLLLGGLGVIGMGGAIFADVGVLVLCVLNSSRLLMRGKKENSHD